MGTRQQPEFKVICRDTKKHRKASDSHPNPPTYIDKYKLNNLIAKYKE
jgi:hypothetical protein